MKLVKVLDKHGNVTWINPNHVVTVWKTSIETSDGKSIDVTPDEAGKFIAEINETNITNL